MIETIYLNTVWREITCPDYRGGLIMVTGIEADLSILAVVLPWVSLFKPPRPCAETTIKSQWLSLA